MSRFVITITQIYHAYSAKPAQHSDTITFQLALISPNFFAYCVRTVCRISLQKLAYLPH